VFESFGLPSETAVLRASGVINIIQLLASMPVIFTLDLLGRRPLLLLGSVLLQILTADLDWHDDSTSRCSRCRCFSRKGLARTYPARQYLRGFNLYILFLKNAHQDFFTLSYGASWGPISWTIPSEIFPTRLRARGVSLSTASNWVGAPGVWLTLD